MSHKIWSDSEKNRLYVSIDKLELERMAEFQEKLSKEISKLKNGFSCVCDFRSFKANYELIPTDMIKAYPAFIKWLDEEGMEEMIRVVGPQIYMLTMIMEEDTKTKTPVSYVDSMERAEWALDKKAE